MTTSFKTSIIKDKVSYTQENTHTIQKTFTSKEEVKKQEVFVIQCKETENISYDIQIVLKENTNVHIIIYNQTEVDVFHNITLSSELKKNSNLLISCINEEEGKSSIKIINNLKGEQAQVEVKSLNIGKGSAMSDVQIQNISHASDTKGNILNRVILDESAQCQMQSAPVVQLGASGCVSHLEQKTLILGQNNRIISIPVLSVSNNQVEASHTSTISTFQEEDLFYLQSRGLDKDEAKHLLLDAFIQHIIENIPYTQETQGIVPFKSFL